MPKTLMNVINKQFWLLLVLSLVLSSCSVDETDKKESSASHKLPIGASANDFLSDENYTAVKIEIVYVTGFAPTESALTELRSFFNKYTYKPDGIIIETRAIGAPNLGTYSLEELRSIEEKHRTAFTSGSTLGAFIFFADNKSETAAADKTVIGKAYRNTSMVIFEKEVRDLASSSATVSEIEHTVMRHEFGHLFGLVNTGSPAQSPHEDTNPEHKAHCNVSGCLMTALIEFRTKDLITGQFKAVDLDPKCHTDLVANGGRG